jgi:hypothetical protein
LPTSIKSKIKWVVTCSEEKIYLHQSIKQSLFVYIRAPYYFRPNTTEKYESDCESESDTTIESDIDKTEE